MPDELARFDEAFLAGTAAEVTPIREIAGRTFRVGPMVTRLAQAYRDLVLAPPPLATAA